MAAYAITRERTLRGMGSTFAFVPRRRGLSGLGQTVQPQTGRGCYYYGPDGFTIESVDRNSSVNECTDSGGLWNPGPTAAPPNPTPPVQIVLPSSAVVPPPPKYAPVAATSWFDQQMIAGLPNSYLALATAGLVLMMSISGAKRRR